MKHVLPLLLLTSSPLFAGTMDDKKLSSFSWDNMYFGIDGGYAMSLNSTNLSPVHNGMTSFTIPENTTFQRDVGNSEMIGGFIGYQFNKQLSMNLNYDFRNQFDWEVPASYPSLNLPNLDYFTKNIRIQTLFVNVMVNPIIKWGAITPYVQGGIGAAWNTLNPIWDVNLDNPAAYLKIKGNTVTQFAWNVRLGVDYAITSKLHCTLGYRFVDAGILESGNTLVASGAGLTPAGTYPTVPFKSNPILLNEIILDFRWQMWE